MFDGHLIAMPRAVFIVLLLAALAPAQSTRPADGIAYQRADGRDVKFVPATGAAPSNRDAVEIRVRRPGQSDDPTTWGRWIPATQPATRPTLPPIDVRRPTATPRGDGLSVQVSGTRTPQAVSLSNAMLSGYRQNIALGVVGPVTLDNVRSVNAYRELPGEVFVGQGMYVDRSGPITIRGSLFGWNGWQTDKPLANKNGFRHGIYQNVNAGHATIEDTIFVGNACAGVQLRAGGTIRRCVFVGNAIGLLAVAGEITLEDCVFVGGGYYANTDDRGRVKSWSGNSAVYAYTPVTLRRCTIVGSPGQAKAPGVERAWVNGALATDRNHRDNPGGRGRITCESVRIVGWPARTVPGTADVVGDVQYVDGAVQVDTDGPIKRYMANEISGAEAVRLISDAVRGAVN